VARNYIDIVKENKKKHKTFFYYYDPIMGIGSPVERTPIKLFKEQEHPINIPVSMLQELTDEHLSDYEKFCALRIKHDFEYWAATCAKIVHKISKSMGPFILRQPQLKVLKELERMRLAGVPIRIIILKARQWGGSTLIQMYMAWIQLLLKKNWHSVVIADVEDQSNNIRQMYHRMLKEYPKEFGTYNDKPYGNSSKNRVIEPRGNVISIGSYQKPDSLRSGDVAMSHMSEIGLWRKTLSRSPEDLVQTIRGSIPNSAYTLAALESTAKGVGNFFHQEWLRAIRRDSIESGMNYTPVFVAWFEIDIYRRFFNTEEDRKKFFDSVSDEEWVMWDLGATLEGLFWYRTHKTTEGFSDWRMQSEFPSSWQEAFQSTGSRAFQPSYVSRMRGDCCDPIFVGDIRGKANKGEESLKDIKLVERPDGPLKIWKMPERNKNLIGRYCGFADIGGKRDGSDWSVLTILDRTPMLDGGVPEVCLTYRTHLDQDLVSWRFTQICKVYHEALLAVEANSLNSKEQMVSSEGDHFLTVLDEIVEHYDNLFARTPPEKIRAGFPVKWGFWMTAAQKSALVDGYNAILRDMNYVEYDDRALDEADIYEMREDGTYGNVPGVGNHDDILVTRMGSLWLGTNYMEMPYWKEQTENNKRKRRTGSMAEM
jgi:hypothetical protein